MTVALPYFAFRAKGWLPVGRFASFDEARRGLETGGPGVAFVVDLRLGAVWRRKDGIWDGLGKGGAVYQGGDDGDVLAWAWRESAAQAGSDFAVGRYLDFEQARVRLLGQLDGCTLMAFETVTFEVRKRPRGLPLWQRYREATREAPADARQAKLEV